MYLLVNSYVKYDPRKTPLSLDAIKVNIRNSVATYRDVNLNKFSARFILSKLQDSIDGSNLNAILGSETTVRLQKRFLPVLNQSKNYKIIEESIKLNHNYRLPQIIKLDITDGLVEYMDWIHAS